MIVCGVDACLDAARAALVASDLAATLETPLLLLHVAPPPWLPERMLADWDETMQEEAAFDRAGFLATILEPIQVNPAATVQRVVEFGEPVDLLRSVAVQASATHLVVGTRGQGAVENVLLASTSGALARDAPCPVILVPPDVHAWIGGGDETAIVCAVDSADLSLAAVRAAAELAARANARLVLAHVVGDGTSEGLPGDLAERVRAAADGADFAVEILRGHVAEEVSALAGRERAALVTVGSRGRGALAATVLGSVSRAIVQKADVPVMVVTPTAAGL